jgi:hypothetical protein
VDASGGTIAYDTNIFNFVMNTYFFPPALYTPSFNFFVNAHGWSFTLYTISFQFVVNTIITPH